MDSCQERQRLPLIAAASIFLLAWLLPNHYAPWTAAYQDFASFAAGLFLLLALLIKPLKITPTIALFLLLPIIPLVQFLSGIIYFVGDTLTATFYLAGFALMLFAGYNLALEPKGKQFLAQLLAGLFIAGAALSLWLALRQWLLLSGSIWVADLPPGGRPFANLAQPNNLATLISMGIAGVLYLYEKFRLGRFTAGLLAIFLLFGLALTQSRTPWIAVLAGMFFLMWKSRTTQSRLSIKPLIFLTMVYVVFVLLLSRISQWLLISSTDVFQRAQSLERWDLWVQLWQAIWAGPIWGYGWNQVSVAQVNIALSHPAPLMTEHSHNILLDLLIWNGPFLGGLIILLLATWLIRMGLRAETSESVFALLAAGFMLVHAMLEFPLEYAFFLLPLGVLLGMVESEQQTSKVWNFSRWLLGGIVGLAMGLFAWIWCEYRVIEEDYRLMRFETANIGSLKAEQPAPDVLALSQLREFIRYVRTPAARGMTGEQLEWMRKIAHRYSFPPSLFRYALALAFNGQPEASHEQLLILRGLHGEDHLREAVKSLRNMEHLYPELTKVLHLL